MTLATPQELDAQEVDVLNLAELCRREWKPGEVLFSRRTLSAERGPINDPRRPANVAYVLTLTAAWTAPFTDELRTWLSQNLEAWAADASQHYQISGPFNPQPLDHEDRQTAVYLVNFVAYVMDGRDGYGHGV